MEDKHIEEQINKSGYIDFQYNSSKNAIHNIEKAVNKDKDKKQEIKNALVSSVSKERIKKDYRLYIDNVKRKTGQFTIILCPNNKT